MERLFGESVVIRAKGALFLPDAECSRLIPGTLLEAWRAEFERILEAKRVG